MQLNRQTDYALRVLVFLAVSRRELLIKQEDIAKKFFIAPEHLTKIISKLSKLKYIDAIRGKGGGVRLNSNSLSLTVASVVKNFESSFKVIDCEKLACPINKVCRLRPILGEASKAFVATLEKYTLADLLPRGTDERLIVAKKLKTNKV